MYTAHTHARARPQRAYTLHACARADTHTHELSDNHIYQQSLQPYMIDNDKKTKQYTKKK